MRKLRNIICAGTFALGLVGLAMLECNNSPRPILPQNPVLNKPIKLTKKLGLTKVEYERKSDGTQYLSVYTPNTIATRKGIGYFNHPEVYVDNDGDCIADVKTEHDVRPARLQINPAYYPDGTEETKFVMARSSAGRSTNPIVTIRPKSAGTDLRSFLSADHKLLELSKEK